MSTSIYKHTGTSNQQVENTENDHINKRPNYRVRESNFSVVRGFNKLFGVFDSLEKPSSCGTSE